MLFEWDEHKNRENKRKHGIAFEEAVRVFADPNLKIVLDSEESEIRWHAVGFADKMLFVVFTEREKKCSAYYLRAQSNQERNIWL